MDVLSLLDFLTFSNTTAQDTVEIDSVTNSTQIILKGYPLIANTTGIAVSKLPSGVVYFYDSSNKDLHFSVAKLTNSDLFFLSFSEKAFSKSFVNSLDIFFFKSL